MHGIQIYTYYMFYIFIFLDCCWHKIHMHVGLFIDKTVNIAFFEKLVIVVASMLIDAIVLKKLHRLQPTNFQEYKPTVDD